MELKNPSGCLQMTGRLFNPGHCRVCGPSEYAEKSERSLWKLPGPEFQYSSFHGVCFLPSQVQLVSFVHLEGAKKRQRWLCGVVAVLVFDFFFFFFLKACKIKSCNRHSLTQNQVSIAVQLRTNIPCNSSFFMFSLS